MSKLEVAYDLDALLIALLASLLISKGIWEFSFLVLGASSFLLMITWKVLSFGSIDTFLIDKIGKSKVANKNYPFYSKKII